MGRHCLEECGNSFLSTISQDRENRNTLQLIGDFCDRRVRLDGAGWLGKMMQVGQARWCWRVRLDGAGGLDQMM